MRIRRCFRAKPFLRPPMSSRLLLAPINGVLDDVNHLLVDASVFALCKDLQLAMKPAPIRSVTFRLSAVIMPSPLFYYIVPSP